MLLFITSAQVLVKPLTSLALLKTSCIGQTVKMKNKSSQPRLPHGGKRCMGRKRWVNANVELKKNIKNFRADSFCPESFLAYKDKQNTNKTDKKVFPAH